MRLPESATNKPPINDVVDADLLLAVKLYLADLRLQRRPDAAAQRGWEQFYFICDPMLRANVATAGLAQHERADCLQEAWLRLVRELPEFNFDPARAPFSAWLRVVARNTAIDRMRRASPTAAGPEQLAQHAAAKHDQVDAVSNREQAYRVLDALGKRVTTTNYEIARLRWAEGRGVTDIASRVGLTAHQVSARLHRMKKLLHVERAEARTSKGLESGV